MSRYHTARKSERKPRYTPEPVYDLWSVFIGIMAGIVLSMLAVLLFWPPCANAAEQAHVNVQWPVKLRLPNERTDATPLQTDEIAKVCLQAWVFDTAGNRSALSDEKCLPLQELLSPPAPPLLWVVAPNWRWGNTRPVYDSVDERNEIGRATQGEPCGDFVQDSTAGLTWRRFDLSGGLQGVVLCSSK